MTFQTLSKIERLRDRAHMLRTARQFFFEREILEVDCPALCRSASVDTHIDLMPVTYNGRETAYLHSSPEYGMKRLLAEGIGDIAQLSHVFRDGECSHKHNPEFMMAEWYRCGMTFSAMIEETVAFIRLFLGDLPFQQLSYREIFLQYADLDYLTASPSDLVRYLKNHGVEGYPEAEAEGKDALLNLILGILIEPKLGLNELCVLAHYPASQSALAKTVWHGDEPVAERFEIYFQGVELANGYHELTDEKEQRKRLVEANERRQELGKNSLPIDERFLEALDKGVPDSCGVAVGFDRLMMLRHQSPHIGDSIPFSWEEA